MAEPTKCLEGHWGCRCGWEGVAGTAQEDSFDAPAGEEEFAS